MIRKKIVSHKTPIQQNTRLNLAVLKPVQIKMNKQFLAENEEIRSCYISKDGVYPFALSGNSGIKDKQWLVSDLLHRGAHNRDTLGQGSPRMVPTMMPFCRVEADKILPI